MKKTIAGTLDFSELYYILKKIEKSNTKNDKLIKRTIEFLEQSPGRMTSCYGDGVGGPCYSDLCKRCTLLSDLKKSLHQYKKSITQKGHKR